jgi:hypothetical protein
MLERSLDGLRRALKTDAVSNKRDVSKMMRERALLTKELNVLRRDAGIIVYIYIYIYIYVCIYIRMDKYIYIHTYMHINICINNYRRASFTEQSNRRGRVYWTENGYDRAR